MQDDKGNESSTRLIKVMVFGTLCLCYLIVTIVLCFQNKASMPEIGAGVCAFAGLLWTGSTIQKAIENKGMGSTPPPPVGG